LVEQNKRILYSSCTIYHTITQMVEALHHKPEGCGWIPDDVTGNFN